MLIKAKRKVMLRIGEKIDIKIFFLNFKPAALFLEIFQAWNRSEQLLRMSNICFYCYYFDFRIALNTKIQ